MNTGRTVSMFMTGSPAYKGEVNGWKSNGRVSNGRVSNGRVNNGSMNGGLTNGSSTKQYEPLAKQHTPKSSSISFFSCCSSDADQQKYETNIFSGVDLKPIKRNKMNGDYQQVKNGYENIGSNLLQQRSAPKQKSYTSGQYNSNQKQTISPKYSSYPSPYSSNNSPPTPTLRVSVHEPSKKKDLASPLGFQQDHASWYNSTGPPNSSPKPKALKSRPPATNGNDKRQHEASKAKLRNEMERLGEAGSKYQQDKERYKWILMKYDMERDNRLAQAEQIFMQSQRLRPEERVSQKQYQEMKIRIEWDVAWRIFDHVNEINDTEKVIDLNCLDINEAQNITKQCIIEIAQKKYPPNGPVGSSLLCMGSPSAGQTSTGFGFGGKHQLLSILCASDHYAYEKKYEGGPTKRKNQILKLIEEDLVLEHYFIEDKEIIIVKIDSSTMENPVLKDW